MEPSYNHLLLLYYQILLTQITFQNSTDRVSHFLDKKANRKVSKVMYWLLNLGILL